MNNIVNAMCVLYSVLVQARPVLLQHGAIYDGAHFKNKAILSKILSSDLNISLYASLRRR